MSSVKISIIVAVNKGGKRLDATLDSIKSQTFRDYEVIMLDAASTDGTAQVMEKHLADKRFSLHKCDDISISAARNLGISLAKGKYIAFADSDVVFSKDLFARLYDCAEKEKAELCVAPMTSTDEYGEHSFSSSGILARRKLMSRFDTDILWNPAVTNKLFLKSSISKKKLHFNFFGKAREAAFTVEFALGSEIIAACSMGSVCYVSSVINDGVSPFPIEDYTSGYEYIVKKAEEAFDAEIEKSVTDFDKKELRRLRTYYIDCVYNKEVTVLLYSYYRHFWLLDDESIKKYVAIITELVSRLSPGGRGAFLKKNKDIFYNGALIDNKKEMAENPKVTLVIAKNDKTAHHHTERLDIQVSSIFGQTMPSFELLVDGRLRDIFPERWKNSENVRFIEGDSLAECKNLALDMCRTDYIMFQDGFARLNPKLLMRHYLLLAGKDKYGFSTSPLSKFDGEKVTEYSFTQLCYRSDLKAERVKSGDFSFALDLFFANKLFRTEHLRGIRFNFSDNSITDMYKLYTHSRFRKLAHTGAYIPYTEQQAVEYLLTEKKNMPSGALSMYKKYKKSVFRDVRLKNAKNRMKSIVSAAGSFMVSLISSILTVFYSSVKLKNRVFFYSTLEKGRFNENLEAVYGRCESPKVIFRKAQPHSRRDIAKIRRYLLTSKVIVIDCELEYLRGIRLRPEQKVIQLWHKNGAFRRFGIDKNTTESHFREYKNHSQYSDVAVSGEYVRQFYTHAFGVDYETVKALGSPSTDELLGKSFVKVNREIIENKHPLLRNRKVYVYFPTYRESEGELAVLNPKIDWAKLNRDLADDEIFVVSRHPLTPEVFFKDAFYSRVKDYTKDPTSELLSLADVIITDYSSIIFDASLLKKPMVFYCPDFGEFEPDFYLDYENELPGEIVKDSEILLDAIRKAPGISDDERISAFRKKYMDACDGRSTERILQLIGSYLE